MRMAPLRWNPSSRGRTPGDRHTSTSKSSNPSGQELLTTQIYTSGSEDSADVRDAPDLLATYVETDAMGVKQVLFDFVVEMNE